MTKVTTECVNAADESLMSFNHIAEGVFFVFVDSQEFLRQKLYDDYYYTFDGGIKLEEAQGIDKHKECLFIDSLEITYKIHRG